MFIDMYIFIGHNHCMSKRLPHPTTPTPPSPAATVNWHIIVLGIVMLLIVWVRIRLLSVPLERDEGEYAYAGSQLLQGVIPYKEAYNMKLPGTYFMYAVIMAIFGKSVMGIHIGLMLVNLVTILLLFLSIKKLFNATTALVTASLYGLMTLSPEVFGFAAHATHFVVLFVSSGLYVFAGFVQKHTVQKALLFGLMMGWAFIMKQQAVFFILFGAMALLAAVTNRRQWIRYLFLYLLGAAIPYLLILLMVYTSGAWDTFWFWTVTYARSYAGNVSWGAGMELFSASFVPILKAYSVAGLLSVAGLVLLFTGSYSRLQRIFTIAFLLFSFASICPGFYFRQHYFITVLPSVALLSGIAIYSLQQRFKQQGISLSAMAITLIAGMAFATDGSYYLSDTPEDISKNLYGANPFAESPELGSYIRQHTQPADKIAILGSEPQILFYADRKSATGYIYTYSLMELHPYNVKMQQEMIKEIEANQPEILVFCKINSSWAPKPESPNNIMEWFFKYSPANYHLEGIADIWAESASTIVWGKDAQSYRPKSEDCILIFRRNKGV